MYEAVKRLLLRICSVPHEPDPPQGSPGSLVVFRAAQPYFHYRLVVWALSQISWLVGLASAWLVPLVIAYDEDAPAWLSRPFYALAGLLTLLWALNVAFGYAAQRLDYELRWYMVTDRSLRIREGLMVVKEATFTFANVQNISVQQGPLQRYFGISDLRVQTAGGGGSPSHNTAHALHIGMLCGLDNAEQIRELMLERLREQGDAGLGDPDDPGTRARAAARPTGNRSPSEQERAALASVLEQARALRQSAQRAARPGATPRSAASE